MKNYKNKIWLQEKFDTIGYKTDIAKLCSVSVDTIEYWRKKFNIPKKIMPSKNIKYKCDKNFFLDIDTEEKAYWLGFIMADGYMNKEKTKFGIMLDIKDVTHLEKFNQTLNSNYPIITRTIKDKRGFTSTECCIRINSKYMCETLMKNDIYPNKTGNEIIPNSIPYILKRHFIRGYFDGDGSISKISNSRYYRFGLGSCSKNIMDQISHFILNTNGHNIKYYISNSYSKPFYYFSCNNHIIVNDFLHTIYDNSTIFFR